MQAEASDAPRAKVRVYKPCDCDVCRDPRRHWSSCPTIGARYVTTYACAPKWADGDPAEPHPDHVAWIRAQHPTADLIYLDLDA